MVGKPDQTDPRGGGECFASGWWSVGGDHGMARDVLVDAWKRELFPSRFFFTCSFHSARPRLLGVPCECSEPSPFPSRPLPALPRRNAVRLADRNGRSLAPQHRMPAGSARRISEPRATDRERGSAPLEAQSLTVSPAGLFRILLPGTRPRLDPGPVHLLGRHLGRLLQISPWTCPAVGDGRQCLSLKGYRDHANAQHRGLACVGEGGGILQGIPRLPLTAGLGYPWASQALPTTITETRGVWHSDDKL